MYDWHNGCLRHIPQLLGAAWLLSVYPAFCSETSPTGRIVAPVPDRTIFVQKPQGAAMLRLTMASPALHPAGRSHSLIGDQLAGAAYPPFSRPNAMGNGAAASGERESRGGLWAQQPGGLPAPSDDPLRIDPKDDPVLALARSDVGTLAFHAAIAAAVSRAPSLEEAIAQRAEAQGARNEALARRAPIVDLSFSSFKVLSRAFSNDPDNVLERIRPDHRTDANARVQMPLIDFGATGQRISAGGLRLQAAVASVEDTGSQVALRAVGAWYTVYGYRALVRLAEAFALSQRELRARLEDRVEHGVAAPGDVAQVDSYIATSDTELADFHRSLSNAEAQYLAVFGAPAPVTIGRAPAPDLSGTAPPGLAAAVAKLPSVRAAQASADAASRDVRALRADRFPQLTGAVDAGRYGVIETTKDYDVRGTLTLSLRLGGGAAQRSEQARARALGAQARVRRTREEAERDAQIAYSDVGALEASRAALEANYIASRRSRDVLVARFRVSRGTLFDVLGAESNYFGVASRFIQTVIELDTARYVLLARTGRLLATLDIDPRTLDQRVEPEHP